MIPARKHIEARRAVADEARAARDARRGGPARLTVAPDSPTVPERLPRHLRDLPRPAPLPSREQLIGAARYRAAMLRVHGRNLPRHAGQIARWDGVGAAKAGRWWWDLATAPDHRTLYKKAAKDGDRKGRDGHLSAAHRSLGWAVAAALGASLPLMVAVAALGRQLGPVLYLLVMVSVLAAVGRQPDEHLPPPAPASAAPALAPDTILKAFEDSGFSGASTFGAPSREGKGINKRTKVIVDLGRGKAQTASEAIKARELVAAHLRRHMRCVHLTQGGHAGQVILTVLDTDPMDGDPVPSPLLAVDRLSLWDPVPWGFDIRGNLVRLPLLWTSLLVGAKPRMGKTFGIRLLVLAAVLDPHCRVYLWDGKGAGDYRPFRALCTRWGQGHSARKGHPKACLDMLRSVSRLVEERSERIDQLPTHLRPQGKLTREVAENPEFDLPLIVVVVDEVQRLVSDEEHGEAVRDELIALAQNAPSCGVILIVGTQRPTQQTGRGSLGDLPPAMGSRAAFKTMDGAESNIILGNGHAGAGWDSSKFPDEYEGVCLLRSSADVDEGPKGVQQVKTHYADDVMLDAKCLEIAARRGVRPTLVSLEKPAVDEGKARLEALFEAGEDRLFVSDAARRADVDNATVRAWCKDADVVVRKVRIGDRTNDGFTLSDLD